MFKTSEAKSSYRLQMIVGTEWLIEATGCDAALLRDEQALRSIFDSIISDLGLKAIDSIWHKFPGEGGVTGLVALTESHLACHTYPEHGTATFNLYCCRTRPEWDWEKELKKSVGAAHVSVTKLERGDLRSEIRDLRSAAVGGDV
jgi:S-adenosylmethionine decarboxylase